MAGLQCKMCGGDLALPESGNIALCEFCGLQQTIPSVDDEKKLALFERANRLRRLCEFDKAAGVYESIVAEFSREAEAWWGLVLCKYGIEYVEDPATGKAVPTCHRSSFDSVMDDSDLEMALENTDQVTRKQYREDAKQIEEIRKGIIAVSAAEEPYDVFICYKETDDKGERTLDSVLAQDIYKELTREGYRVFFARITLEDKLGVEYEPYIFAALNSAKVMLAIGTDYEYYNAVWVKNEWSRFLKLMEQDHSKHLIPCYKDIDAYDLPKEFKRLQAQNLGKVGAVQDILHGIEKLIPKKQPAKEAAAQNAGKVAPLLDRGRMALEDGDWQKADGFFEEVLNNDSQNAQAYLGKLLAQEHCATLEQLAERRKSAIAGAATVQLSIQRDKDNEGAIIYENYIKDYVSREELEKAFRFDPEYDSQVPARTEQLRDEKQFWEQNKLLKRVEQFADANLSQRLKAAKDSVYTQAEKALEQATAAAAEAKLQREKAYAEHIEEATEQARKLHDLGEQHRSAKYQEAVGMMEKAVAEKDLKLLVVAQQRLEKFGDYQNCKESVQACKDAHARISDEQRLKHAADIAKAKRVATGKKVLKIVLRVAVVLALIGFVILLFTTIIPTIRYNKAVEQMESGNYSGAATVFIKLDDFKDSRQKAYDCITSMIEGEQCDGALELLNTMEDITATQAQHYACAEKFLEKDARYAAAVSFGKVTAHSDAFQRSRELWLELTNRQYSALGSHGYLAAVTQEGKVQVNADWLKVAYGVTTIEESPLAEVTGVEAVAFRGSEDLILLMSDGTVKVECVYGSADCEYKKTVEGWKNVIDIAAYENVIALCMDGTVCTTASDNAIVGSENLIDVVAGNNTEYFGGIRADGTVWTHGTVAQVTEEIAQWTDIVDFDIGGYQVVGLKSDGSVLVSCSYESDNQTKATDWTDAVEVACGYNYVLAIRSDGEIFSTKGIGFDDLGFATIEAGRDEYHDYYIGVKADGTLRAYGEYRDAEGNMSSLSNWSGIKVQDELPDYAPEDQQNTPALPPQ